MHSLIQMGHGFYDSLPFCGPEYKFVKSIICNNKRIH